MIEEVLGRDLYPPLYIRYMEGERCCSFIKRFDEAILALNSAAIIPHYRAHAYLAAAYAITGNLGEADSRHVELMKTANPLVTFGGFAAINPFSDLSARTSCGMPCVRLDSTIDSVIGPDRRALPPSKTEPIATKWFAFIALRGF